MKQVGASTKTCPRCEGTGHICRKCGQRCGHTKDAVFRYYRCCDNHKSARICGNCDGTGRISGYAREVAIPRFEVRVIKSGMRSTYGFTDDPEGGIPAIAALADKSVTLVKVIDTYVVRTAALRVCLALGLDPAARINQIMRLIIEEMGDE